MSFIIFPADGREGSVFTSLSYRELCKYPIHNSENENFPNPLMQEPRRTF
jgi:hypothetical protein